jgi:hypothetical protein
MGSPYLNSGESIILTTNRVSVSAVTYDIMLTTERVFLIDNRNARFEPRIVALSTILSVQGGKTPAGDPVITLLFRAGDAEDTLQPLNMVFSQNPNENRKPERDDWVRSLIQLSISLHERETEPGIPGMPDMPEDTGLRPSGRHGNAPDRVRPLSNVVDRQAQPAPVTVIPEDVEGSGEIPVRPLVTKPVREPEPAWPAADVNPVHGTLPPMPAPHTRVIIPQIIEELLPAGYREVPPVDREPEPAADFGQETPRQSVQRVVRSLTFTEEPAWELPRHPETVPLPEPVPEITPAAGQPAAIPSPEPEPEDVPEIIRALHTGAREPEIMEKPAAGLPGTGEEPVPEPVEERPEKSITGAPESQGSVSLPENRAEEPPAGPPPVEAIYREEPAGAEPPPVRHPIPPAHEIRPLRTTLAYAAVLILALVLVAAAAILLLPHGTWPAGAPVTLTVTPAPGIVPVTTVPPETVPAVTSLPSATRSPPVTPSPSLTVVVVPRTGIWVRVNSSSYYAGKVGNSVVMQPVSGTGDRLYKILPSDSPVQVSVQKQDNSGAVLSIAIYRNGTLIGSRSINSPMGTVDLLIDPLTALPPGLTTNDTPVVPTTSVRLENF